VGQGSGSPFQYPNLTSEYITNWVRGAKSTYNLDIDYIGVWVSGLCCSPWLLLRLASSRPVPSLVVALEQNERSSDATYVKTLRQSLNAAGFSNTKIVARDGSSDICNDLANDPVYNAAVHTIGLHYPSGRNPARRRVHLACVDVVMVDGRGLRLQTTNPTPTAMP
jgi:galactosylceramidase